ncbi:MAG: aminotransferase class III-fold pyridoxal phosphate-dependent enzyme [Bacteroidetes bacterium]|nr:aminotransferase class III-fold pyridoxal phosphate-dependent enzyme [Bacteroidota bacterium]
MSDRYHTSEDLLERALRTIPLGSQTFSKSITQLPKGVSPFFADHALGSKIWDVDGNEYVDFMCSLMAVSLGYNDPDVTTAVSNQLQKGSIYSLAHPLEFEVAEKICEMVPCAEKVRFGKNGSDATAGAIRVARAYTGRDHVLVCGYHGWQDWYIGVTTRNRGVPQATRDLSHMFMYNDIESLEKLFSQFKDQVAAVILEPYNSNLPNAGFLEAVKEVTHKNGAILIFDETITGFRTSNGGAQQYFGVTPDLATFGKGLSNGFPVSAVAGRGDLMKMMEEIFFSFTFGGETLSLAASLATMDKLNREPVTQTLFERGELLVTNLKNKISEYGLSNIYDVKGLPVWTYLTVADSQNATMWELKTLLIQEMFSKGIFNIGQHGIMYAHSNDDIHSLLNAYDEYFQLVLQVLDGNPIKELLRCAPLVPLFKVR